MNTPNLTLQFKNKAEVSLEDGTAVGRVDRVVLDPRTREVTDIVVRKGVLFTTDRVVPVDWITSATDEGVTLRVWDERDMEALPEFETEAYVQVADDDQPYMSQPPASRLLMYPLGLSGARAPVYWTNLYAKTKTRNIPADTVALKEGAQVKTRDGEHVGDVEEVLTDAGTDRVTGLIISQGLIFKDKRRVPITWVDRIESDAVHLLVGQRQLEALVVQES